jgi:alkylhydroperoxidase/carboxymuconolactone decarboxylase family protein YurZ
MTDEHTPDVAYSDEKLAQTVMGDDLSRHRMHAALHGPAGIPYMQVMGPNIGKVWDTGILPIRTAGLVNLAILATLHRPHEIYTRIVGLLLGGVSVAEIQGVLLHVGFYAGMPTGVEAIVLLQEAMQNLTERGIPFNREAPKTAP